MTHDSTSDFFLPRVVVFDAGQFYKLYRMICHLAKLTCGKRIKMCHLLEAFMKLLYTISKKKLSERTDFKII